MNIQQIRSISILAVAMICLYVTSKYIRFVIPESESVNGSLFLVMDKNTSNDYVIFSYNKRTYKSYYAGKLFIKRVGCDSGEHLIAKNHQAICNGRVIATMFEKNKEGQMLPSYEYNGVIPDDKFFALGEHIYSFDSRYFGLVEKKQIINTARRIF